MPYIHLTATPQYKGAIPEPFTGSISYIHIIMKSKICKVDIRKIEKNVTQPRGGVSCRPGGEEHILIWAIRGRAAR